MRTSAVLSADKSEQCYGNETQNLMLTDIIRGFQKSYEKYLVENCVDNVQNCGLSMGFAQHSQCYPQGAGEEIRPEKSISDG